MLKVISLSQTKTKNALSTSILKSIYDVLLQAHLDESISAIWLESSSDEYFSAGGDVKELYQAITQNRFSACDLFFTTEYATDYLVHVFQKPIVVWVDGILFGGGLGLIQGASHKIFSSTAICAMPEVLIGLFPDVGASHFLQKVPTPWQEAIAERARRITAYEAHSFGLCNYVISRKKQEIFKAINQLDWQKDIQSNHQLLTDFLSSHHHNTAFPNYQQTAEEIANTNYACPHSVQFVKKQLKRGKTLSLRQTFEAEWQYAYHFCRGPNFKEGVRALLIDKDRQPKWKNDDIDRYFKPVTEKSFAEFTKVLDTLDSL